MKLSNWPCDTNCRAHNLYAPQETCWGTKRKLKERFKISNAFLPDVLLFNGCNLKWKSKDFPSNVTGSRETLKIGNMKQMQVKIRWKMKRNKKNTEGKVGERRKTVEEQ